MINLVEYPRIAAAALALRVAETNLLNTQRNFPDITAPERREASKAVIEAMGNIDTLLAEALDGVCVHCLKALEARCASDKWTHLLPNGTEVECTASDEFRGLVNQTVNAHIDNMFDGLREEGRRSCHSNSE